MNTAATCTCRSAVTGICGEPAVYTFTGAGGETFAECAEHYDPAGAAMDASRAKASTAFKPMFEVGAEVTIHRHGKSYFGRVVRVTRTGRAFAEVTYNNGATRVVPVGEVSR